jgi:pyruvate,water dikinase
VDPDRPLLIPLARLEPGDEPIVGGKASKLGQLARAEFSVPNGFCLTTWAYDAFVSEQKITAAIRMELGRKSMDEMRWEEIWDAALRIRATFLAQPLSDHLREAIVEGLKGIDSSAPLAIRSSAIGEDSAGRSFAGLHESIIGVSGKRGVEDAVRLVWASLWSDAALLYRKELGLDPVRSRMAVLVQEMVDADRSGVAFARDPRDQRKDHAIVESVPGPCSLLVDGMVDPDRWELNRETRSVIAWLPGQREGSDDDAPLLDTADLEQILEALLSVEQLFQWSPDMEWTGRSDALTVLQARPITTAMPDDDEKRSWYLTLRPGDARLKELRKRVAEDLIPQLAAEGQALASEEVDLLNNKELADSIEKRTEVVARWKQIYWDDFIPFAHGVRRLATYYNDAVQPDDPYEFVELLRDQPLLAAQRNQAISDLARQIGKNDSLRLAISALLAEYAGSLQWSVFADALQRTADGAESFVQGFEELNERFLDIVYDHDRLQDQPEPLLRNLVELSQRTDESIHGKKPSDSVSDLENRLLTAVGPERRDEAIELIETGRVSWKLRDDDNLLVARLESQLLRALDVAAKRLRDQSRLTGDEDVDESHAALLTAALREPAADSIRLDPPAPSQPRESADSAPGETPRQLIGQPASPGVATGTVRCIQGRDDLGKFRQGEILVCDAIQPTMTHLVPLAGAIVERRGGMLIHGAIIARELGIPCVNGVRTAADVLRNGDIVTVDGHLGIVTVGAPEFDLELRAEIA